MTSRLRDKRRVDALFRALGSDYLLREQFVTDPAQILTEYVSGEHLEPDEAAAANQLVYAIVSNPRLLRWLETYGTQRTEVPSGEDFARDFARALASDGDEQTILAVMRAASESRDIFTIQADVLRGLISAIGRARPGSVFAGTEMSPGSGTEMSSPGTEMSPGRVFAGTEMSSPGTEISPGPGTDMSPGRATGIDIDVTLRGLVEFATELRRTGALNTISFR